MMPAAEVMLSASLPRIFFVLRAMVRFVMPAPSWACVAVSPPELDLPELLRPIPLS